MVNYEFQVYSMLKEDIEQLCKEIPAEYRLNLLRRLTWRMPSGIIWQSGDKAIKLAETIVAIGESLGIDENSDVNNDGVINEIDENLVRGIVNAKRILENNSPFFEVSSEDELRQAITTGEQRIRLMNDILVEDGFSFDKEVTVVIDLNNHTIENNNPNVNSYPDCFHNAKSVNLTLKNGSLKSTDTCVYMKSSTITIENVNMICPAYNFWLRSSSKLYIKSGKFETTTPGGNVVYNDGSFCEITDGEFKTVPTKDRYFTLNMKDGSIIADSVPNDNFVVKGGKFYEFDPSNSYAESGTVWGEYCSLLAPGYKVIKEGNWNKVVK